MYSTGIFTTQLIVKKVRPSQVLRIIPFGDMHCDSELFSENRWNDFVNRVIELDADPKNVVVTLGMGDYIDFQRRTSRNALAGFNAGEHSTLKEALEKELERRNKECIERLEPIAHTIGGFLEGNHYGLYELGEHAGKTSTEVMSEHFNVPYLGTMSLCLIRFGRNADEGKMRGGAGSSSVKVCLHHGKGGGTTAGSTLNRIEKMANFVAADIVLMGHDHQCAIKPLEYLDLCPRSLELREKTRWLGRTGSFVKGLQDGQSSYVADAGLGPNYLGWIEFQVKLNRGTNNDHVEIVGGYGV